MSRGFAEIVLIVKDVTAAARFYREVVGLIPETEPDESWAWFWAGEPGEPQRLGLHTGTLLFEEHSPRSPGLRWGPIHFALRVDAGDQPAAVDRVRAAGVEVFGPTTFSWMSATSYYFYDLDDNLVEWWSPIS